MKKVWVIFTFFIFMFSMILNGLSNIQTKNTDFTNQATYIRITKNQHDCVSLQDTKECQNACHTNDCGCINHSCTGTISLFNLTKNYQIVSLSSDNGFSSAIDYQRNDVNYPITHPPQV